MNVTERSWIRQLMLGASAIAMTGTATLASAQDAEVDEIVVTGIRQSLKASMDVKKNAKGIVDAITAEDIGKFPDTNLAESLQRIPGVSIDRSNGEGSTVTVRGWGADYNLVTFNGRVMPTSSINDLAGRSFDFGNLASEAISSVEVYKTSKVGVASGGAGATINIITTKPLETSERVVSVGVKAVYDTSQIDSKKVTPEISGIYVDKFADGKLGVAVSGSYQKREGGVTQSNVGWRDGYLGSSDFENEWGALPTADSWNFNDGIENRPGDTDVYEVPQNADYSLTDFKRERINGQVVLQYDITDKLRATGDFTYSSNEVETNTSSAGVWFNHGQTNSAWTDGPVAGPLYYTEFLGNSDLSYSGSLAQSKSENISLGLNLAWDVSDNLSLEFDFNDASAESKPTNIYGSAMSIGTTVFSVDQQTVNFENDLPVISYVTNMSDIGDLDASVREHSGSTFTNNYMKSEVQQLQLKGSYQVNRDIIDSVDFGVSRVKNNVRTESGFIQTDSWGGELGGPEDIPDEIFEWVTLPDKFEGVSGADDPNMLQGLYRFDFAQMADLLEDQFGICSSPWNGTSIEGTCLAEPTSFRDIEEETLSGYVQFNTSFNMGDMSANVTAGARYEHTNVSAPATVPVPTGTSWPGGNEFFLTFDGETQETDFDGSYNFFLPSVDFDVAVTDDLKLRGAFSKTIGRHRYDQIQGGLSLDSLFRSEDGTGSTGNPSLEPFTSKNFDVSAEWYYGDNSYVSVGYFKKDIENFVGSGIFDANYYGLTHPGQGTTATNAIAALGGSPSAAELIAYYEANHPELVVDGAIIGSADDPLLNFQITEPVVSDRTDGFDGWEFAIQHTFGETGFGVIGNYTIANTELTYDDTQPYTVNQLAITGVSDSANLVGFYDKNGFQARVAYNWRDKFLSGSGTNPFYVEDYSQIDANVSYEFTDGLTVFAEGIDITGTDRRGHRRSENNAYFMNPQSGRYALGARYKF